MKKPYFIEPQHPKTTVVPERSAIARVFALGFVAQRKVDGHRAQVHVSADGEFVAYTRQGALHTALVPERIKNHLVAMATPKTGWTCLDCEWQKTEEKFYCFDMLMLEDQLLSDFTFLQRFEKLKEIFAIGPGVSLLTLVRDVDGAMALLEDGDRYTEGIVLRNPRELGFQNTAIIRCRKKLYFHS